MRARFVEKKDYDGKFGSGTEYTFQSNEVGIYKTKKKSDDGKYAWLQGLTCGDEVELVKNPQGSGYFINQVKGQSSGQTSEQVFESMGKPEAPKKPATNRPQLMADCFKIISELLPDLPVEERVKMAISLFIQEVK